MMTKYEIMFIVKATLDDAAQKNYVKEVQKLITDNKGKVIEFKELGRKKLAYPIDKEVSGLSISITLYDTVISPFVNISHVLAKR